MGLTLGTHSSHHSSNVSPTSRVIKSFGKESFNSLRKKLPSRGSRSDENRVCMLINRFSNVLRSELCTHLIQMRCELWNIARNEFLRWMKWLPKGNTSLAWWMRFDSYCETVTKILATDGEWHLLCVSLTRIWTDIWSFNRINPSALFLTFIRVDCPWILWAKLARSTLLETQQISFPKWWQTANDANENETQVDVYHNSCWQYDLFLFTFRANSKLRNKKIVCCATKRLKH